MYVTAPSKVKTSVSSNRGASRFIHNGGVQMSQSTVSISMEDNLKAQFEELCDSFGMDMDTAFNVFARAVVRERRIPFEICEGKNHTTKEGTLAIF